MLRKEQAETGTDLQVRFDEREIDRIFAEINQCYFPGATVGIAIKGKPVYRKGFGLANMEFPVVLTPSTRMRVYSVTKHFTCLACMLLCEDGKANVDDPVGKYLPELHPVTRRVTLRQLMGHTSGIRDAHGLSFQFCGTHWTAPSSELIELYRTFEDFDVEPGHGFIYNNGAYALLTEVIEGVSGMSLADFMRVRIFEPVGMYDTLLRRTDADFVPGSAAMHMTAPDGRFVKSTLGGDRSGTGGIASTVNDMLRWLAHMNMPTVGSATTWATMRAPQQLATGVSTGYGLGLVHRIYRGINVLYHPGGGMGANAHMLKVPGVDLDVIVIVNREDVFSRELSFRILDACLPQLEAVKEPGEQKLVEGTFSSAKTGRVMRLFARNGQQIASHGGFSEVPFVADGAGVLRPSLAAPLPYRYTITLLGDPQNPAAIRFSDYGNVEDLTRVSPNNISESPSEIAGEYCSDAGKFRVTIADGEMKTTGRFGSMLYGLERLAHGVWRAIPKSSVAPWLSCTLYFRDSGFVLWSYCTRAFPFKKLTDRIIKNDL